jgi:predicted Zn-dependent peptidase
MRIANIIFVSMLFCPLAVFAQPAAKPVPKQQPPAPGPARPFSFPKFETRKLANGLTVLVVEDRRQPIVSYGLGVDAGSTRTDPKKSGLADMTASMLRNGGTSTRTSQEIARLVDSRGGSLSGDASKDAAFVNGTWVKANAKLGMELLADVVLNPAFDEKELERLRQQALAGLQVAFASPESLVDMASSRVVFGQSPYAYPDTGTPETIRGITRADLVAFHKAHYVPGGAYLAIAGDITAAEAFAMAESFLGKWSGGPSARPQMAAPPLAERKIVVIDKPDTPQTRIFVGEIAIPRSHPDYIPLMLANEVFGGAFTSRLNLKLRATEGLTYNASSSLESLRSSGAFTIQTFTETDRTGDAVQQIMSVHSGFTENPVTASELADAKARLIGLFQLSTETPQAVAQRLLLAAVNGLPPDYYSDYTQRIAATTIEQVHAAAKKHMDPAKTAIVVVGDAGKFEKQLAAIGSVRTIRSSDFDPIAPDLLRAKEQAPAATDETRKRGMQMVQAAVKAMGGAAAIRGVKDMSSKSAVALKTPNGEIKAESNEDILYPDNYRASLKLPFGEIGQVFDGKTFWMKQGANVREMPGQAEAMRTIRTAGAIALLRDALDGKAEVQSTGDNEVLWKMGEETVRLQFDPQTHLVSKMFYRSSGPAGPVEVEQTMSDYRDVGGVQLPFKESLSQAGAPSGERTYTERRINTGIGADAFAKPQ